MLGQLSSGEREFASLVDQLRALEEDIAAARHPPRPIARRPEEAPDLSGERVTLADGAQIVVRQIAPDDMDDLTIGFGRLGALSRFRVFGERVSQRAGQAPARARRRRAGGAKDDAMSNIAGRAAAFSAARWKRATLGCSRSPVDEAAGRVELVPAELAAVAAAPRRGRGVRARPERADDHAPRPRRRAGPLGRLTNFARHANSARNP
jgi:hypothetical protein